MCFAFPEKRSRYRKSQSRFCLWRFSLFLGNRVCFYIFWIIFILLQTPKRLKINPSEGWQVSKRFLNHQHFLLENILERKPCKSSHFWRKTNATLVSQFCVRILRKYYFNSREEQAFFDFVFSPHKPGEILLEIHLLKIRFPKKISGYFFNLRSLSVFFYGFAICPKKTPKSASPISPKNI